MPITMGDIDWATFLEEAALIKNPEGPKYLIEALSKVKNPLSPTQDVWDAHNFDFGIISQVKYLENSIAEQDRPIWLDRLAWFMQALKASHTKRPALKTLVAILHSAKAFSIDIPIWNRLQGCYFSNNLFESMAGLINGLQCSFDKTGPSIPIWESEAVARFELADNEDDWPTIETLWQSFVSATNLDFYVKEATACLSVSDAGLRLLARELDGFSSILPIMGIGQYMTSTQLGKIVVFTSFNRSRFSLIQSLAYSHKNETLQNETLQNLTTVFKEIQKDHSEWKKWMIAFNSYPVRTNSLQPALGISLVNSDKRTKIAYIEAINLSTSRTENRKAVTRCLKMFSSEALLEDRKLFWSLIYEKWESWNFGEKESEVHLTQVPVSEFDYGVMGYIIENMIVSNREDTSNEIREEMIQIQNRWYSDLTSFNSSWYRTLAKWQVFRHAEHILEKTVKWELPTQGYQPFDPKTDRYFALYLPVNFNQ